MDQQGLSKILYPRGVRRHVPEDPRPSTPLCCLCLSHVSPLRRKERSIAVSSCARCALRHHAASAWRWPPLLRRREEEAIEMASTSRIIITERYRHRVPFGAVTILLRIPAGTTGTRVGTHPAVWSLDISCRRTDPRERRHPDARPQSLQRRLWTALLFPNFRDGGTWTCPVVSKPLTPSHELDVRYIIAGQSYCAHTLAAEDGEDCRSRPRYKNVTGGLVESPFQNALVSARGQTRMLCHQP